MRIPKLLGALIVNQLRRQLDEALERWRTEIKTRPLYAFFLLVVTAVVAYLFNGVAMEMGGLWLALGLHLAYAMATAKALILKHPLLLLGIGIAVFVSPELNDAVFADGKANAGQGGVAAVLGVAVVISIFYAGTRMIKWLKTGEFTWGFESITKGLGGLISGLGAAIQGLEYLIKGKGE